ncbi:hypothetical protein KAH81_01820 [bacterium]|nr:hypothetical protein [bacterium]
MNICDKSIKTTDKILLDASFREDIVRNLIDGYPFSETMITICQNLMFFGDYYGAYNILKAI